MNGVSWAVPSKLYGNVIVAYDDQKVSPQDMINVLNDNDFPPDGPATYPDPSNL